MIHNERPIKFGLCVRAVPRWGIYALANRTPTWDNAARLLDSNLRSLSMFLFCLPPVIEQRLIARETMIVEIATATLAQSRRGTPDERGGNWWH